MADCALITSRRALLGAAAALHVAAFSTSVRAEPVEALPFTDGRARTLFARRLARYRRLAARTRESAETGFFRAANDCYNRERAALEARYGSWEAAAATPEGRAHRRAIFAPVAAAEEAFYQSCTRPTQQAAAALALTPAPDLPALLAKIRVMQELELDELDILGRPVLEVLAEDVARLTGAADQRSMMVPVV
jgi:hypothetical protein